MKLDVFIVGVGGQGVLTIAEIISQTALAKGISCNYYPTKGMAQRGGFVKAQLRLGDVDGGPDISLGGADVVIAMEQCEALKAIDYLKPDGDMIVYGSKFMPTDVMIGRADYPSAELVEKEARKRTKNYCYLDTSLLPAGAADNIFLLSAAHKKTALKSLFSAQELESAVHARFAKGVERNTVSFAGGQNV
ncbi:MAG: 2-oxoacid:acceptor oxidoreductase family protein [Clostridia bacterium]